MYGLLCATQIIDDSIEHANHASVPFVHEFSLPSLHADDQGQDCSCTACVCQGGPSLFKILAAKQSFILTDKANKIDHSHQ